MRLANAQLRRDNEQLQAKQVSCGGGCTHCAPATAVRLAQRRTPPRNALPPSPPLTPARPRRPSLPCPLPQAATQRQLDRVQSSMKSLKLRSALNCQRLDRHQTAIARQDDHLTAIDYVSDTNYFAINQRLLACEGQGLVLDQRLVACELQDLVLDQRLATCELQGLVSNNDLAAVIARLAACEGLGLVFSGDLATCQLQGLVLDQRLAACEGQGLVLSGGLASVIARLAACEGQGHSAASGVEVCMGRIALQQATVGAACAGGGGDRERGAGRFMDGSGRGGGVSWLQRGLPAAGSPVRARPRLPTCCRGCPWLCRPC